MNLQFLNLLIHCLILNMIQEEQDDLLQNKRFTFKELSQDALEQLALVKQFYKLYKLAMKAPPRCKSEYQQVKYNGTLYNVGDSLLINFYGSDLLVRLSKIISIKSFKDDTELPLLLINFYCNKDNIAQQYGEFLPCMGTYEIFLTDKEHAVLVDSIKYKISVMTFEEYDQLEEKGVNYYTRAMYNTQLEQFIPSPQEWHTSCFCLVPTNPDLDYILCEICQKWIHVMCAKVDKQDIEAQEHFICYQCQGN
ncbi:hypothetical protein pb186bvf_019562 [Paramecium bursaria]